MNPIFAIVAGTSHTLPAAPRAAVTAGSELAFTLMMEAGGPTAPLVNAMLEPALIPAAEGLAQRIVTHLEKQHKLNDGARHLEATPGSVLQREAATMRRNLERW